MSEFEIKYPACLFHALNLGEHAVKHVQSGVSFTPGKKAMTANHYVAEYRDSFGNLYTVTVRAE